jgi:protein-disulfide isomerase
MNGRTLLYIAGLAVVALFTWGLATSTMRGETGTAETGPDDVLAVVGGEEITRGEIETNAGAQLVRLNQQIFQITEQTLAQTIDGKLVDLEAAKRGLDRERFLASVLDSAAPEVPASQVDSVYDQFSDRIEQPREQVVPQIEAYLAEQLRRQRADSLIAALRDEYEIVNLLEPQRHEVEAVGPAMGPEDAPVTIVEFSDFECPYCLRIHPTLKQVMENYEGQVRLVFRQFPLNNIHPSAQKAAEASLCADEQGSFWEMHDAMFDNPSHLHIADLKRYAAEIGLEEETFATCLDSGKYAATVTADLNAGRTLGVTGTPALFINGRFLSGAQPYNVISRVIDDELQRGGA